MSLHTTYPDFLIRGADGTVTPADALVLGRGLRLGQTPLGIPELLGGSAGEAVITPSGGNDAPAVTQALSAGGGRVRLGPGIFTFNQPVIVPSGAVLAGSGIGATEVRSPSNVTPVVFAQSVTSAGLEGMTLTGAGALVGTATGVIVGFQNPTVGRRVWLRDLIVQDFGGNGISVTDVSEVEISNVAVRRVRSNGISVLGYQPNVENVRLSGIVVENANSGGAVYISGVSNTVTTGLKMSTCGSHGLQIDGGGGHVVSEAAAASVGSYGFQIWNIRSVVLEACETTGCFTAVLVQNAGTAHVSASRSANCSDAAVVIRGGAAVTVDGFVSDQTASAANRPHLLVDNNAAGVLVSSFRRTNNPGVVYTWEADVSLAGGRVVFIQNNFTAGKVNSGGKYVQL
jgi:hypothetical protein